MYECPNGRQAYLHLWPSARLIKVQECPVLQDFCPALKGRHLKISLSIRPKPESLSYPWKVPPVTKRLWTLTTNELKGKVAIDAADYREEDKKTGGRHYQLNGPCISKRSDKTV